MDLDASMKQLRQLWAFKDRIEAILPDLEALIASGSQTSQDFTKVLGEIDPNATIVPDPAKITPIAEPTGVAGTSNLPSGINPAPINPNAPTGPETADASAQGSG